MIYLNNGLSIKKDNFTKKLIALSGLTLLSFNLISCNQNKSSSNSMAQYKQLQKNMGPIHTEKSVNQNYIQTDLYSINPEGTSRVTFEVGKRNVLRINTSLRLPSTKYRLVSQDLPQGSEPLNDLKNGTWELIWTPSADLMHTFKPGTIRKFHVSIEIIDSTDLRSKEIIKNFAAESAIEYTLEYPKTVPEIISIKGTAPFPEVTKLNEGEIIPLSIRIKDESSSLTQVPTIINPLVIDNFASKESSVSGSRFFILKSYANPVPNQPGVWDVEAEFNTNSIPVPVIHSVNSNLIPDKIRSHLNLQIKGANDRLSSIKGISFEITYRKELLRPIIKTKNPALETIPQGSKFTLEYETSLPTSVGTLTSYFSDESVKLTDFPNKPKCVSLSKKISHLKCELSWSIPCQQPLGEISIKLISAGEYKDQRTSIEMTKKLNIVENKKCTAPTATSKVSEPSKVEKKSTPKKISSKRRDSK